MKVPASRSRVLALCLVTAATALGGMFHVHAQVLRARRAMALVRSSERAEPVERVARAIVTATGRPSSAVAGAPQVVAALELTAEQPPALVRLPNVVGLRLTYASHRATRRGLLIEARDERGEPVDPVYAPAYRVVRQQLRPGVLLQSGYVLEVVVRERTPAYGEGC